jgi:hypothetical protein
MKLPNADQAIIDREKITEYLLNTAHRSGASKARFFTEFGFELAAWEVLAKALIEHAQRHEVRKVTETCSVSGSKLAGSYMHPTGVRQWYVQFGNWIIERLRLDSSPLILSRDREK